MGSSTNTVHRRQVPRHCRPVTSIKIPKAGDRRIVIGHLDNANTKAPEFQSSEAPTPQNLPTKKYAKNILLDEKIWRRKNSLNISLSMLKRLSEKIQKNVSLFYSEQNSSLLKFSWSVTWRSGVFIQTILKFLNKNNLFHLKFGPMCFNLSNLL